MTAFASRRPGAAPIAVPPGVAVPGVVAVAWRLARTACAGAGGPAVLTVIVDAGTGRVQATLHRADGDEVVPTDAPAPTVIREDGLEHIDAPGVLSVTLRPGTGGGAGLLFARTPLLERLGVPGGCAEPPELVKGE